MAKEQNGLQAFKAAGNKIASEVAASKAAAVQAAALSPEALAFMAAHATGSEVEDLQTGVVMPQLRIHTTNLSTKNELRNGKQPNDGQIFYTGTQEAWDSVVVVLLAIKKCRLEQVQNGEVVRKPNGDPDLKATYLLAGVIDSTLAPFVMYVKGMSYNKIWNLQEQLKPYVSKSNGGIPLCMVKVRVSSEKEAVAKGKQKGQLKNVFKFELLLDPTGSFAQIESNMDKLRMFEAQTMTAQNMLETIVSQKGMSEREYQARDQEPEKLQPPSPGDVVDAELIVDPAEDEFGEAKDVSDDIPF